MPNIAKAIHMVYNVLHLLAGFLRMLKGQYISCDFNEVYPKLPY